MKLFYKIIFIALLACSAALQSFSQSAADNLPKDYLSNEFHAGRREALRKLMPGNSVAVIWSYPERVFSKDVNYVYHPNPDLYYFSGYKEPNAMLLIFKDMQTDGQGSYNELFFVQHNDPLREQWTGRRLGVAGTQAKLGFKRVYNGEEFARFPLDLKKFSMVIYDQLPDDIGGDAIPGSLKDLLVNLKLKAALPDQNKTLMNDLALLSQRITPSNLNQFMIYLKPKLELDVYKSNPLIQELVNKPDSATLTDVKAKINADPPSGTFLFNQYTISLRGVKTPEELELLKKSVEISSYAHAEAMRAVSPKLSERQLEGIMLYVHKFYGAEDEGYPPIVGAGANGCILHYEENNLTTVNNQLVLMDVGAEYHGYSADVTRTFPANGKFSDEQKSIYQLVYDAQEEIFKLCREGVPFSGLNMKATEVLASGLIKLGIIKDAKEVNKYYPHGCSHHLGLDVHDKGEHGALKENMVITVEPGIYIPAGSPCDKKWWNIGVRIEDDVVIGKDKCTLLSADAPRKWEDVEKMVAEKSIFDQSGFPELK